MHIYVDADACPVIRIVENIARKYNIETTLICDTNHVLTSDYSDVVTVSAGADAVDFRLVNLCTRDDIFAESFENLCCWHRQRKGNVNGII